MRKTFQQIGLEHKTDKIDHHRYDRFYPIFFEPFRDQEFNLLEIGVAEGKSLLLWKEYFPKAKIHGIDVNKKISEEFHIIQCDQSKIADVQEASKKLPSCKIIIDDGSHQPQHQINSFFEFWQNNLEHGGIYVIEDIECNYWNPKSKIYGYEVGLFNIIDYFTKIPDQINSEFSEKKNKLNISSITFAHNCIILVKQTQEEIELSKRLYRHKKQL